MNGIFPYTCFRKYIKLNDTVFIRFIFTSFFVDNIELLQYLSNAVNTLNYGMSWDYSLKLIIKQNTERLHDKHARRFDGSLYLCLYNYLNVLFAFHLLFN